MLDHHPVQTPRRYLLHQVFKCEDGRKKTNPEKKEKKTNQQAALLDLYQDLCLHICFLSPIVLGLTRHREPQTREIVLGDIGRQLLLRYWGGPQNMRITDFQKIICYWSIVNCTGLNAFLCQLI